jgi:SatD family (SatD)
MTKDEATYTVIIGDISGSKQLTGDHRFQTQLFIKSAILQINEEFGTIIEAPLTITKGDEFQGLFGDLSGAFKIALALERLIFPVQVKFGFGVGQVYKMGGRLPIEMDGPAFHNSNAALQFAKKKKICSSLNSSHCEIDILVNAIFKLITAIKYRWNERHYKLYWKYNDLGTYRKVAELENITPQAVCDVLKNIRAMDVRSAEESLFEFFDLIYDKLSYSEPLLLGGEFSLK